MCYASIRWLERERGKKSACGCKSDESSSNSSIKEVQIDNVSLSSSRSGCGNKDAGM